jgi:glycosyltransferase involved in cell wall biosynthesis
VKVSVCIPTYNSGRFLGETIESVLAQRFRDFELVVCDNASTDETPELCARYRDPRFRYVRFEELVGQAENWNRCLELAQGELIILLHGDDLLAPDYLERAVPVMDRHPEVALLFCCAQHIDAEGKPLRLQAAFAEDIVDDGMVLARLLLLKGCEVNPAGVLVRRSAYEAVGRFTEAIVWGVDWHMWVRLALRGQFAYLAEPLSRYRIHGASGTSGVMATARNVRDERWMFDDLYAHFTSRELRQLPSRAEVNRGIVHRTWCFAEELCRTGFSGPARAQMRNAIAVSPACLLQPRFWVLWAATYLGYNAFSRLQRWKHALAGSRIG